MNDIFHTPSNPIMTGMLFFNNGVFMKLMLINGMCSVSTDVQTDTGKIAL